MLQGQQYTDGGHLPETELSPEGMPHPVVSERSLQGGVQADISAGARRLSQHWHTQEAPAGEVVESLSSSLLLFALYKS